MALIITDDCINCGYCIVECPNQAIYKPGMEWSLADGTRLSGSYTLSDGEVVETDRFYPPLSEQTHYIVPEKCSECKGAYDLPQCAVVCPNPESFKRYDNDEKIIDLLKKQFRLNPKC